MRDVFTLNLLNVLKQKTLGLNQDLSDLLTSEKGSIVGSINSIISGSSPFQGIISYDPSVNLSNILDSDYNLINVSVARNLISSNFENAIELVFQSNIVKVDFTVSYVYDGGAGNPVFTTNPSFGELVLNTTDLKIYEYDDVRGEWNVRADLGAMLVNGDDLVVIHDSNGSVSENNNVADNKIRLLTSDGQWHVINPVESALYMSHPENSYHGYYTDGSVFNNNDYHYFQFFRYDLANNEFVFTDTRNGHQLRLLTGTNYGDVDLGTFSGSTISDNATIKQALQELETALENTQSSASSSVQYSDFQDSSTIDFSAVSGDVHADIIDGSITDSHIASNANISADKLISGSTNAIITLAEKGNYDSAYNHSQITSGNPHQVSLEEARSIGNTFAGNISMGGYLIQNVGDPVDGTDAVNKQYVDNLSAGLDPKQSVRVATTADLNATYDSATMKLTANSAGAISIDGISLVVGDRILVKDQNNQTENGIYVVDTVGDASTSFVLVRASDFDGTPAGEVSGGNFTFVEQGTVNAGAGFVVLGDGSLTLDTDNIVWTQFSGAGQITAGVGLTKSGNVLSVLLGAGIAELPTGEVGIELATNSGLILTLDGSTSTTDSDAKLMIDPNIAGDAISFTAGVLDVLFDDSSIGLNGDGKLEVKDAGITAAKLDTGLNAGQVNASVIPFDKSATFLSSNDVNAVIKEVFEHIFEFSAMSIDKTYDSNGLLSSETYKKSSGEVLFTIDYVYKTVNNILVEDTVTKKVYDGTLTDVSSATPIKTITDTFTYDANGNVTNISRTVS